MGKTILGVMGVAGSGKTLFTDVAELCGYKRIQMAHFLKGLENGFYNILRHEITSNVKYSKQSEEYSEAINAYNLTKQQLKDCFTMYSDFASKNSVYMHNGVRRNYLQYLGTEIMRDTIGQTVHIDCIVNHIKNSKEDMWCVESVRFINEIEKLMSLAVESGGKYEPIYIFRPDAPELIDATKNHRSEVEWVDWVKNNIEHHVHTVNNDGSKLQFVFNCARILKLTNTA